MAETPKEPVSPIQYMERDRPRANALQFTLHPHNPQQLASIRRRFKLAQKPANPPEPHQMEQELSALAEWIDELCACLQDLKEHEDYVPHGYEEAFFNHLAMFSEVVKGKAKQAAHGAEYSDIFPLSMSFPLRAGGHEHTLPEDMAHELTLLQNTLNRWRHFPIETESSGPVADRLIKSFCHQMEIQARDIDSYKRTEILANNMLESELPAGVSEDAATVGSKPWLERIARQVDSDRGPHKS